MTRRIRWRGVVVAATGALTAVWTLAATAPPARADELSDLRANQELLQRRLDQLAQVGLQHPQLPPGTASIAGSFPRSFLIPGTSTSIAIGGLVDLAAAYWFQGGGQSNNSAAPPGTGVAADAGIPLDTIGPAHKSNAAAVDFGKNWFRQQSSESRLFIETRTPTAWGQALTHLEFDFYGCTSGGFCSDLNRSTNGDVPRLRLAYGTLGGFLAGQTWVPGQDLASSPELFDFFGVPGVWGFARVPQIGYKTAVPWLYGATFGGYLVQPSAEIGTPEGASESDCFNEPGQNCFTTPTNVGAILKDPAPDLAAVLNWEQPWGHLQFHGALLFPEYKDPAGAFDKHFVGGGGGVSGNVHPFATWGFPKDDFGFNVFACEACGHWSNWTGGSGGTTQETVSNYSGAGFYGAPGVPFTAATAPTFKTVTQWGFRVNYQHWWAPTVRSTVAYGVGHQDIPTSLTGPFEYNKELRVLDANLIWSPVSFINTGLEFTWNQRKTVFNNEGNGYDLSYNFVVKF